MEAKNFRLPYAIGCKAQEKRDEILNTLNDFDIIIVENK